MSQMWPHQQRAVTDTVAAIAAGQTRICLTSPTGGGKGRIACELIDLWTSDNLPTVLYTNRRMLVDQLSSVLSRHGLEFGVRAAGHQDQRERLIQISSIQTEGSRALRRTTGAWELHRAKRVLVDEVHLFGGKTACTIINRHLEAGAAVVGLSATPIGIGHLFNHLIVAGTNSELRACGALVRAQHFGPDEPDLKHIGKMQVGRDLTEKQTVKAMMTPTIFARVFEWWGRLNPMQRPTILFAPGVAESVWFAEQFQANGVTAASVDGEQVWIDGKVYRSDRQARAEVLEGSKGGEIKVVCNRFVLREGIDMPWIEHGILATVFGSLQSYLQSGGRLLRAASGKTGAIVQDHGGAWWRHGSLNADREWNLTFNAQMVAGLREDRIRAQRSKEPSRCPRCAMILMGLTCSCGFVIDIRRKSRPVIQADGSLREHFGDIFKPMRVKTRSDTEKLWERMYWRARNSGMTFRQALGLFARENYYHPPRNLPLMPFSELDFYARVQDVPRDRLTARR